MKTQWQAKLKEAERLRQSDSLYAFLSVETLKTIADLAPVQVYPTAAQLFQQGAPPREVYLITRGLVKLTSLDQNGQEIIVSLRAPGGLLGADAVLLQRPYAVTAAALNVCHLHRLRAEDFRHLIDTHTLFSRQLHQIQNRELYDQTMQLAELKCLSARQRLEEVLCEMLAFMEPRQTPTEIRLLSPLRHWEIAQLIAVTPTYLSRLFKQLEDEALLRRSKGWLIFPNPQTLKPAS